MLLAFPQTLPVKQRVLRAGRWSLLHLIATFLCGASAMAVPPRKQFSPEQVKAVFVINFCRFATWPDDAFPDARAPLRVGIWADNAFTELVRAASQGEQVGQRAIEVQRIESASEAENLHLLFIPAEAEKRFEQSAVGKRKKTLLAGDSSSFLKAGGHLQLITEGGRIKIAVNRAALKQTEISLSSTLLRIAEAAPTP